MQPHAHISYLKVGEQQPESKIAVILPEYQTGRRIKHICYATLCISYPLAIACLITGIYALYIIPSPGRGDVSTGIRPTQGWFSGNSAAKEFGKLAITVSVSFITDALGYIHSVSLRWSLFREGRLQYNSNIRLWCYAKSTAVNSWYANLAFGITLVFAYAAGSAVLDPIPLTSPAFKFANSAALLLLGFCILIQTVIAHACVWNQSSRILSWSSDPLNTALVCVTNGGSMPDTLPSLTSAAATIARAKDLDAPRDHVEESACLEVTKPSRRQPSMLATDKDIRWVLGFSWAILVLPFGFVALSFWGIGPYLEVPVPDVYPQGAFVAITLLAGFQMPATAAIHCAEVVVNRSRDESQWKRLTSADGYDILRRSTLKTLTSWQSIILFTFKALVHWLFGSGIEMNLTVNQINFLPGFAYPLTVIMLGTAIFVTLLALWRPKRPQPSTYGHLDTLLGLIDDWGSVGNGGCKLLWGDKGETPGSNSDTRHAGTAGEKSDVGYIMMDALYL